MKDIKLPEITGIKLLDENPTEFESLRFVWWENYFIEKDDIDLVKYAISKYKPVKNEYTNYPIYIAAIAVAEAMNYHNLVEVDNWIESVHWFISDDYHSSQKFANVLGSFNNPDAEGDLKILRLLVKEFDGFCKELEQPKTQGDTK